MKKTLLVIFLVTFSIIAVGKKAPAGAQMPPAVVNIVNAKSMQWQQKTSTTGSLAAFNGATLKAEAAGRITKIFFKSGQSIKTGAPLVQIYPDVLQAQLKQAEAQLIFDKADYARAAKLGEDKYISASDLQQKQATMQASEAKVNEIQADLNQTLLQAPFDGQLGLRKVSLGDYVAIGTPIVDLESLSPIRVDFSLPEIYLGQIKIGQAVTVTTRAFPDEKFNGTIYAMNSAIDPDTRSIDLRAKVDNPKFRLMPGAFVEIAVPLGSPQSVIVVPQSAIVYAADGDFVYKVVNQKAVKTDVTLGPKIDDDEVIIQKGLKANDPIISDGQIKVSDGDMVMTTAAAEQMMNGAPNKDKK